MFEKSSIGFIGGGNMGEALTKGLLAAGLFSPEQIHVFDVSAQRLDHLSRTYRIQPCSEASQAALPSDILVIAVKPQTMSAALELLRPHLGHRPLVISIAAGVSLAALHAGLPEGSPVIRVMPNTPALVQQGASALAKGAFATDDHMARALALFRAVGTAIEVEEKWMDAVTGLSGSGPGYVLLLLEALVDAGVLVGLPRQVARELTIQTMLGTLKMVQETGRHPAELRELITSPAGTTIRGLQAMEDRGVRAALLAAVEAATLRSHELGKG